jgi:Caspase domain/Bacterial Ig domain
LALSPDGNWVGGLTRSGEIVLFQLSDGRRLATLSIFRDGEWLVRTEEGYFDGSKGARERLVIRTSSDTVTSMDQLYQALYRPDLVTEKLAGDPKGLVREAAARLDLEKVIASGVAPKVSILSPITGSTGRSEEVTVEVEVSDQGGGIGRVEWRVNGLTLGLDDRGVKRVNTLVDTLAKSPPPPLRISRKLTLEPGDNVIEVVAYNSQNLIESRGAQVTVKWDGSNTVTPPKLYVLAVGTNDYWDSRLRLSYAVPDAKAIADALRRAGGSLYGAIEVKEMLDADVSVENLDKAFNDLARRIQPRDVFVFFLAGHGKTVDGKYYFLPRDFRYEGEESIVTSGVDQDRFQSWLARIPARKSILLYDTCESGSLTGDRVAQRGLERVVALDKMTRAMGRTVLSASSDDGPALEGYKGHGVFTYAILEGMAEADTNGNGLIEVTELAGWIDQRVPDLSYEAFKQRQVPQMKIVGSNFPLGSKVAVLGHVEASPAVSSRPTHVVIQATDVFAAVTATTATQRLAPGTLVTLVRTEQGWVLIAKEGRPLGYVAASNVAPIK